ncbi:uncharacterized protein LOC125761821 [Anopheles funestus]|uniref:uncharacterized protein LOC125761821 n=1 Tax=Anopheles funestus TaxID=62324 RepID=UPI0020C5CFD9|nr:uncharacterized protein LOC125761821 [Anopheles funestus]
MNSLLCEFVRQLPADNKFQAVLKIAYWRILQGEKIDANESNKMCRKCHMPWTAGYFTVEVIPKCNRSSKQIEKLESRKHLTKQQQSLVKHLKTRVGRVAKYTCQICSCKTRIPLDARVKLPKSVPTPKTTPESTASDFMVKKPKREENLNAGIKIPPKPEKKTKKGKTPAALKNTGKQFKPTDFKLIQQLLESAVSSKSNTMANQKPKVNQPVGRLRLSRN